MERRNFVKQLACIGIGSAVPLHDILARTVFASPNYEIEQFEVKGLAHFSYAVRAGSKVVVIDPQRNPGVYYDYAKKKYGEIIGVVETHPHADFVSAHQEMHQKLGVPVYASSLTEAAYRHTDFDEGKVIKLSDHVTLRALYTPGHAPDHISVVLAEDGRDKVVFSGDALFIGDVGRPDLREFSQKTEAQRQRLAEMMYDTVHTKFAKLADDVVVYPAHGAGSLCGKSIRKALSSTIGEEKQSNYAFEKRSKEEFVKLLLSDQPFIPAYFKYDVELNMAGAPDVQPALAAVKRLPQNHRPEPKAMVIDARPADLFKASYIPDAINIQGDGAGFVTWLGTVVHPDKAFYLVAQNDQALKMALEKTALIGYESKVKGAFVYDAKDGERFTIFDKTGFDPKAKRYTYIDVRTTKEAQQKPLFDGAINIPLQDLEKRFSEIPTDKPILVSCASGYRSATASSLIRKRLPDAKVYDLGADVVEYLK
ncbi:MBL fold metallo-hydrolase [Dyadobacter fermentans]|uniref:Beta-lactamase domain protein n=1 Tax=Dyadobacter fermentans (strain ATCC 700827 / DSM 18053 / CIP 107007 / KCTC 52180 / NS114) TaxID=471854 RepID=C6W0X4_DYAFD|nr:MBL fold metallo-hydrolase [Dyadobacter fermentans]ACT95429.1 beta-lactamase domain protein [Dyadobacter fermentans DSM 18053]